MAANYIPVNYPERKCTYCSAVFKPPSRRSEYCSKPCRWRSEAGTVKIDERLSKECTLCGTAFVPSKADVRIKYCSKECKRKADLKVTRISKAHTCVFCNTDFYPLKGGGNPKTYCSNSCSARARGEVKVNAKLEIMAGEQCAVAWSHCRVCSTALTANPNAPRIVCKDCFELHGSAAYTASQEHLSARLQGRPCKVCGKDFVPYQNASDVCSLECRRQTEEHKTAKRIHRAKRRAMERTNGPWEDIDPIKIFERDGWCCWLCGISTPKELRGTYHNRAPELDHKVPVTRGGMHASDNVACSCRDCNQLKSDKIVHKTNDDVYVIDSRHKQDQRLVSLYA